MPYDKAHKFRTQQKIIRAATDLFSRSGFEHTSIGQIMQQARLTHGAFYAHFESKEALYTECFSSVLVQRRRSRLVKKPLSINNLLSLTIDYLGLRQFANDQPGPEAILFNEVSTDNEKIKNLFQQSYKNVRTMLEKRLTALARMHKVSVTPDMIAMRSRSIMAALIGAVTLAKMLRERPEKEKVLQAAQTQIVHLLNIQLSQTCGEV